MSTNTLTDYSALPLEQSSADRFDQYRNALLLDVVPRNSSGVPTANAGKCGTATYPFSEGNFTAISIGGLPFDPENLITDLNQVISGAVRSGSQQPLFLQASGSAASLTILGTSTNLVCAINGVRTTVEADITVSSLTTAPSTNNTCLVNSADFADQYYTTLATEIPYDTEGSEITALDGKLAAFECNGEYFIARIDNTNKYLLIQQRGFFFNSSNAPVERQTIADNDTITLRKLAWVYLDSSGSSASVGYTEPTYSGAQPASGVLNDYWFDLNNQAWKRYDGSTWQTVNRILIGWAVINTTACVATRSANFTKDYKAINTFKLQKVSNSTAKPASDFNNYISVFGNDFYFGNRIIWDMASHLESGVVEASNTIYYFYITEKGEPKISDKAPNYNSYLRAAYHPFYSWRWVGTINNDGSANLETAKRDYIGGIEIITTTGTSYWIRPPEVSVIKVRQCGAGSNASAGSNGQAGAYLEKVLSERFLTAKCIVGNNGATGGSTTFSAYNITALSTTGGVSAGTSPNSSSATGGDINIDGGTSTASTFATGTPLGSPTVYAETPVGFGGGGFVPSGNGRQGIIIIEYIG